MSRYKVAVIGAGIGAQHITGFSALPEMFDVSVICDLDTGKAAELAGPSGPVVTDDLSQVLADPGIDIVDICLPPHLHFDVCAAGLTSGKDVICEKPLAGSVAEADRLAELSHQTGKQIFPVFQYRYGQGARQLKALIEKGIAGTPYIATLETHWCRDSAYYDVGWRGTWAGEKGGAILGHAIHIHDWLSFVLGPVQSVFARLDTRVNPIEVEDCAALSLQMQNGALVTSSVTLGAAMDTSRLRFCFEHVTAESGSLPYRPAEGEWQFTARTPAQQDQIDDIIASVPDADDGYAGLFSAIGDFLDNGKSDAVFLEDGRHSLEFVTAVYHSAATQMPVSLPIGPTHPLYQGWVAEGR